jgi:WD40 repeat protein
MSKRAIRSESSSSAAHKRQAVTPQDEDPLPSSSSSLAQQASSLSTYLIADLILPFIAERATWNSVCSTSKDLRRAGKKMTPPWPIKAFNLGHSVDRVAFSPPGSQLAFCLNNDDTDQHIVHIWDRWGKETLLVGHTEYIYCLEYSLGGEYLASGSAVGSIRIWNRESYHAASSQTHRETPARTPKQADTILLGGYPIMALSFSRTDSNILASGGSNGEIKLWDIKEQACIHSIEFGGHIHSIFFAGGADVTCLAAAQTGSIIRIWRAEGSSDFAGETIGRAEQEGLSLGGGFSPHRAVFSPSGSFLTTTSASTLASYELETMTKTQSVVMPGFITACLAFTPDSKQLVVGDHKGRIRLLQADDLSIQRDMDVTGEAEGVCSAAFDPTCRILAVGCREGRLELRGL